MVWLQIFTPAALLFAAPATPPSPLKGPPMSPALDPDRIIVRYMYDGGVLAHARICLLDPKAGVVTGDELLHVLETEGGVDFSRFYASVYETELSGGGWIPINRSSTSAEADEDIQLPIPSPIAMEQKEEEPVPVSRRIDVKLFPRPIEGRPERIHDSEMANAAAQPTGKLPSSLGYYGVGVMGAKTQANVGTLWRSAYQLGASFLFTIGQRYRAQSTDTVKAPTRIPLFELDDWEAFAKFAPRGAKWVAVEMGGVPLEEFEHPHDAVYILGSEDNGVPNSVVRSCHHVVSLDSERYASYNVAVAASLVMYDRMTKMKTKAKEKGSK